MKKDLPAFVYDKYIYLSYPYIVLDFEATTLPDGPLNSGNDLVLCVWKIVTADSVVTKHLFADEYGYSELLKDINSVNFVVAHNAKYELQWLHRCGLDLRTVLCYCTMLGQWVLDGNLGNLQTRSLDSLAKKYNLGSKIDIIKLLWKAGVDTRDVPKSWLLKYCEHDVDLTHQLFTLQLERLQNDNLLHLAHVRNLTCCCLSEIEFNGMNLDGERVLREYNDVLSQLGVEEKRLFDITGGINLRSPQQRGKFIYETLGFKVPRDRKGKPVTTASGGYPTDSDIIGRLHTDTEDQRAFLRSYLDYTKRSSLLSKSLDFFKGVVEEYGGWFRAKFNQGVTATHRLSSSGIGLLFKGEKKEKGIQFQNVPRQYKKLFWSGDEDYLLGEADGAQLEFRVAVDLCRDSLGWQEIADGVDVHSITAEEMTKAGEPTSRQDAKARTFRPLINSGFVV